VKTGGRRRRLDILSGGMREPITCKMPSSSLRVQPCVVSTALGFGLVIHGIATAAIPMAAVAVQGSKGGRDATRKRPVELRSHRARGRESRARSPGFLLLVEGANDGAVAFAQPAHASLHGGWRDQRCLRQVGNGTRRLVTLSVMSWGMSLPATSRTSGSDRTPQKAANESAAKPARQSARETAQHQAAKIYVTGRIRPAVWSISVASRSTARRRSGFT